MRILYENENYSKYGNSGRNYVMALLGTTFYITMTLGMLLVIAAAIFPDFYSHVRSAHFATSAKIEGLIIVGLIALILRLTVKEEDLSKSGLTKEYVKKAVNYLLVYIFIVIIIIVFVAIKYLRHYAYPS